MNSKRTLALFFILATAPALALAQDHGGGGSGGSGGQGGHGEGGGGSGCGDVFGDLVHVLREADTGQPILQKRTIEDKGQIVEGYCPIPISRSTGGEIGFMDNSCDVLDPDDVIEVDYFGRLSGGRTKERNSRMHFDEVISSIKDPDVGWVGRDETGRMKLGYDCEAVGSPEGCVEFRVIDSPMENLALYTRLLKYGHFQTDPMEEDAWSHGDPAAGTQYHPALHPADYLKFDSAMLNVLPGDDGESAMLCFGGEVYDAYFNAECAVGQPLHKADFTQAASFLAAASGKTGKITVDLVQYLNRILRITRTTDMSTATKQTLPARIRDCGEDNALPFPDANGKCKLGNAKKGLPAPADELFVKFNSAQFDGEPWRKEQVTVLQEEGGSWTVVSRFNMNDWLLFVNGDVPAGKEKQDTGNDINGFVRAASDALRSVEFVHNYAIPDDLWTIYLNKQE